jgi:NAD(P) transhydrogenase subunit alpha
VLETMRIGIVKESFPGERRVALVPASLAALKKAGAEVLVEAGAGTEAGFTDREFADKGATLLPSRGDVLGQCDILLQVRTAGANPVAGAADVLALRKGQVVVGTSEPLTAGPGLPALAAQGVTTFALELIPRITRAQSMDVLSSMATIAGYRAVLLAATTLPRMFPMLMTAAGTIAPARVFVIGAGVAGLQAIATARRLGAKVEAYDVRPAVKEQVQSLGGKFVELPLETAAAEDKGGYARAQDEDFYRRQRELLTRVVAGNDVVITTAAVPGQRAPILITADMVAGMAPGSVVVDLAAERGGNCELTRADETVVSGGVTVLGPTNLPSAIPYHASQMYSKNITTFLLSLVQKGTLTIDRGDEVVRETLVTRDGELTHPRVRQAHGLPVLAPAGAQG